MRRLTIFCAGALVLAVAMLEARPKPARGFDLTSLKGSYGSREAGDGHVSAGLGIATYDGEGNSTREITVNAPDGAGGRQILIFTAVGTYTVNEDGTGVATYNTTLPDGSIAIRTFDFVITGSDAWTAGKPPRIATQVPTAQREAGVTVKLVTGVQTRVND